MPLIKWHMLLELGRLALHPAEQRGRSHFDAALLHPLR